MAFYAKYKNKDYQVNLNQASSNFSPANTSGRDCSTTQAAASTRTATGYYSGTSPIYAKIASQFTQTITLSGGSYVKAWSVSRGTSPEEGASTGTLASGTTSGTTATVYLNDTLTATATAADTSYSGYNFSSLSAPTVTATSSTAVSVKNNNAYAGTIYYGTSSGATTYSASIGASATITISSNLSAGTKYYFTFKATQTRSKYTHAVTLSWTSKTVSAANTLTITGTRTTTTESGSLIASSSTAVTMPSSSGITVTLVIGGTYASSYRGTLALRTGSATGTVVWSKSITSATSSGTILGTYSATSGTKYYLTGDEYGSGRYTYYVTNSNITPTSATTATFSISRTAALLCMNPGCLGNEGFN